MEPHPPTVGGRRRQIDSDAYCPTCGYNLRGCEVDASDTGVCPECAQRSTAYFLLERPPPRGINSAQWSVAALIAGLAVFVIGYRLLAAGNLQQTAALFVGLPAVLAIIITLAPRARSATGMTLKGMTIALLVSGTFLGEGFICVLMMAPIFYGVGIGIGLIIDFATRADRRRHGRVSNIRLRCWIVAPIILLSLEGVTPQLSFSGLSMVSRSAIVDATPSRVAEAIASTPRFDEPLPMYLGLGFPRPTEVRGRGLEVGDERVIHFRTLGGGGGDLRLRIAQRGPGRVVFEPVSDTSQISRWMRWRRIEVSWSALGAGRTSVTWRIGYERRLDPAWYFAPWQRYAVGLAAEYLIRTVSTPTE